MLDASSYPSPRSLRNASPYTSPRMQSSSHFVPPALSWQARQAVSATTCFSHGRTSASPPRASAERSTGSVRFWGEGGCRGDVPQTCPFSSEQLLELERRQDLMLKKLIGTGKDSLDAQLKRLREEVRSLSTAYEKRLGNCEVRVEACLELCKQNGIGGGIDAKTHIDSRCKEMVDNMNLLSDAIETRLNEFESDFSSRHQGLTKNLNTLFEFSNNHFQEFDRSMKESERRLNSLSLALTLPVKGMTKEQEPQDVDRVLPEIKSISIDTLSLQEIDEAGKQARDELRQHRRHFPPNVLHVTPNSSSPKFTTRE